MRPLFIAGIVLLILGLASLVVPIPQTEREGIQAGGMSMSIQTQHSEKVSPIISAVLILAGAAICYAGRPGGRA
jgi:hypothetical protein